MRQLTALCLVLTAAACEPGEDLPDPGLPTTVDTTKLSWSPDPVDFGAGFSVPGSEDVAQVTLTNGGDELVEVVDAILSPAGESVAMARRIHEDILEGLYLLPGDEYTVDLVWRRGEGSYSGRLELLLQGNARKVVRVVAGEP